ncbi:MAG: pyruvate kinase [Armatimonadaceae bacterium]
MEAKAEQDARDESRVMRRTKIVCTLGPAVDDPGELAQLATAGMDVARLNFSHGTHEEHARRYHAVREAAQETGKCIAILQDLCGPKIRIGTVAEGTRLRKDARFILTTDPIAGNEQRVHLPILELFNAVQPGNHLLLDDGLLELVVTDKTDNELITRVIAGGVLGSRKGISAPGVPLDIEAVTDKDEEDVRFGLEIGVDFVALSFVRHAHDVLQLRKIMEEVGRTVPIIVKIEKDEAVQNLDSILAVADGAMVARGDLGIEMPMEEIATVQKRIIRVCNRLGKPVITATQMLDSMIRNPRPTRAEVTDIANAVLDGTDALMLSGETAVGAYPIAAVEMMARIAECAEGEIDHDKVLAEKHPQHGKESITDAISEAVVQIAHDQNVAAIVCSTSTGGTARAVSRFKPRVPVLAATTSGETFQRMALYWGVRPMLVPFPKDTDQMIAHAVQAAVDNGHIFRGDKVVVTAGTPIGVPGSTNLIKVHTIGQPLTHPADASTNIFDTQAE